MKNGRLGLLFLLPALCIFAMFQWYTIFYGLILGFQKMITGLGATWVGLANFKSVLSDSLVALSFRNTLVFVGLCLVFGYMVPVVVAIALTELRHARGFFRLAIYMPNIIPGIALYIMWLWIFDPAVGLLNQILGLFHLPPQEWLLNTKTALFSLMLMATWAGFGSTALFYMASLTSVPEELYEAAEIDGAGIWRRIFHITLPSLKTTMLIMLLLQILATVQVFQEPFVMTGGGPNNATLTIMYQVYRYAFVYFEFGKAGALGFLTFLFLFVLSLLYMRYSKIAHGGEEV
ncbi:MAG: sugar ABC transporter permease [Firmicutes bacterium]|nr:sugar ABC transporter permease [Bacillota bacterium]